MAFTKTILLTITLVLASHAAYKYFRRKPKRRLKINDVIMFSNKNSEFKSSKYLKQSLTESVERLFNYLSSSCHSLDICMYVLTNSEITNIIIKQHLRGVKIRVILDADMAFSSGSTVKRLEKHGIHVRWMKATEIMHNKYCIIDGAATEDCIPFVMTGSLNWTNQALYRNWENVLVTSQKHIVYLYKVEFEKMWEQFKPIVKIGR
ncbi:mitochondrial cardiolipin hydrolase-like [Pieris napi]|uniref:mitochondrial cardiolipin hydrolase-like n=1 Tax=Pieris napi TaxID=78633 RepID=UPI001FB8C434|nr:mitochondrial cardiolipin hydrolase-like [Pieris napi]